MNFLLRYVTFVLTIHAIRTKSLVSLAASDDRCLDAMWACMRVTSCRGLSLEHARTPADKLALLAEHYRDVLVRYLGGDEKAAVGCIRDAAVIGADAPARASTAELRAHAASREKLAGRRILTPRLVRLAGTLQRDLPLPTDTSLGQPQGEGPPP